MTKSKAVLHFKHDDAHRRNIPTAEQESFFDEGQKGPVPVTYPRNRDLDPQLMWRGKDEQNTSDLVALAPPIYTQEKIHPQALMDDLLGETQRRAKAQPNAMPDLFGDFNGLPEGDAKTEFYQHDQHWTNRMILGDSLQVMASLAEREELRGKVQCIYFDPPYGIKFNSNFQWSTGSRDVKDGNAAHITREPEQVKAFRDTWKDGIHSYLTYLRDRLMVMRDLLTESGSIFVQIGDENVHRVRAVMDEVFGESNYIVTISVQKTGSQYGEFIQSNNDSVIWYARNAEAAARKYRPLFLNRSGAESTLSTVERDDYEAYPLTSDGYRDTTTCDFEFEGKVFHPGKLAHWKVTTDGLNVVAKAGRIVRQKTQIRLKYFFEDYPVTRLGSTWNDVGGATGKVYVVQTSTKVIERCILMTTDPGDLVLDPTCGSGTTAYVAEQWGRRWITIDTSRVALALARARLMGARYPYYLLADSPEGRRKEAEVSRSTPKTSPTHGQLRQGFVYERVPHITLKSIANNAEIDVIWEQWQEKLEPLREKLNGLLDKTWEEWQIPREPEAGWSDEAKATHAAWWEARIARQKEIDASIAAKAEYEYLYDKPYVDNKRLRVAGPFTVDSLSPHRMLASDENGQPIDPAQKQEVKQDQPFETMILEQLRAAGVQQADKGGKIDFTSLTPWPGEFIAAEGRYMEGDTERRAAILIGPEFGTVLRADLVEAAREAADARFDVLIACAFNFEAHTTEFNKLGKLPVLKARMNADLHMAEDLKATGKGNLFVVFGEPDIELRDAGDGQVQVQVKGVDVFNPATGAVQSDDVDGIACWFVDTNYNNESFFVRHAYFLGQQDPYTALKTTLRAEVDAEAWESLNSDTSRPFPKPGTGRVAVKVINHLGDEVMKVLRVE
ncbi:hypothetical protein DEIPH_ctg060orf0005 [Deinococcus phoenicis]|uniref:DNA methylase N-4/N-6 domain-containing protein n=1 Tax=Deinococcus phoenicis TaxID=1476583 RepID=A0A016QLQ7_9DEIO|nr:site-specific DNA-methyltransferase [Deinococcus phoenicis]EYB66931.1 hypothetical protein DEIPH_ctg060orf0005 [Deinococcus phoenicis]